MDISPQEKCQSLKRRIKETEQHNDVIVATIERTKRMIQRARLERALLLERLERQANAMVLENELESPPESPLYGETPEKPAEKRKEQAKRPPAVRDPSLPKRPQNAYIIFCDAERDRIKQELEESDPNGKHDLNKVLNEKWKQLGPAGRNEYQELYKKDRIRYAKEMALVPSAGLTATVQKEKQRAATFLKKVLAGEDEVGQKRKRSPADDESDFISDDGEDVTEDEDLRSKHESVEAQPAKRAPESKPTPEHETKSDPESTEPKAEPSAESTTESTAELKAEPETAELGAPEPTQTQEAQPDMAPAPVEPAVIQPAADQPVAPAAVEPAAAEPAAVEPAP